MKGYDNFFLPADNLGESRKFYAEILGLPLKFDFSDKGMAAYNVGGEEPAIILKEKAKFPNVKSTIWFVVDDVRESYAALSAKGVEFMSEPFRIKTGWAAEFKDQSETDWVSPITMKNNNRI